MKIETKYNVGDKVYVIDPLRNEYIKDTICRIEVKVLENRTIQLEYILYILMGHYRESDLHSSLDECYSMELNIAKQRYENELSRINKKYKVDEG